MRYRSLLAAALTLVTSCVSQPHIDWDTVQESKNVLFYFGEFLMFQNEIYPETLAKFYDSVVPERFNCITKPGVTPSRSDVVLGRIDFVYCGAGLRPTLDDPYRYVVMHTKTGILPNNMVNLLFLSGNTLTIQTDNLLVTAKQNGWIIGGRKP